MPNTFPADGNVGIGTVSPEKPLHLRADGASGGSSNARIVIENGLGHKWFLNTFSGRNQFSIGRVGGANDINIDGDGNVGIGTTQPNERLEVNGNILATGDVKLAGGDCAEDFDIEGAALLEPGTVVVIGECERLKQCCEAYDRRVAGVLSGAGALRPGIVLDSRSAREHRRPVALSGKVYCRVDATYAPIEAGDMLSTSRTPGHAMKACDAGRAFGAVLGKALRPLVSGRGLIPILVCLQ